jgi:UDP-N-acetylmuramoyl-tripeptide--D-alanyl-D-alanine ligase
MFELGVESEREHQEIVDSLFSEKTVQYFFIGAAFYISKVDNSQFHFYESFDAFSGFLKDSKIENSTILIKGSRGMALERTLEYMS